MKILFLHSQYIDTGGEEESLYTDQSLLGERGHESVSHIWLNADLTPLQALGRQVWSRRVYRDVTDLIEEVRPDILHIRNTTWSLGPAAVHAASDAGVPVVATLSNERLRFGLNELIRNPYNGSLAQSAVLAIGNALHFRRTWASKVGAYIAVSNYIKRRMMNAGLPAGRIVVRPGAVFPVPVFSHESGDRFLYVGRITEEKGVPLLLDAWRELQDVPLDIVGRLPKQPRQQVGVTWHGRLSHDQVLDKMSKAKAVIVPSIWQEPSSRAALEAMACGTPVIAANVGGLPEVHPAVIFEANRPRALIAAVRQVLAFGPDKMTGLRLAARATFEQRYSPAIMARKLLEAYDLAAHASKAKAFSDLNDPATDKHLERLDTVRRETDETLPTEP